MADSFNLLSLVRPNLRDLKPYRSARDDFKEGMLLDANENPYEPFGENETTGLNRYPDPHFSALRDAISSYRNVKPEHIFLGNGSDEAIDLLIRLVCEPGKDALMITPPTYGMYKVSADIHNVTVVEYPLKPDFSLDKSDIIEKSKDVKIIFLCSPNNPTSNSFDSKELKEILDNVNCLVVVDEAYIDFSSKASLTPLLDSYPNLVILQTLSKAFGLAGIRLGMAFGSEEIIQYLMKIKPPYNVNALTQQIALNAFKSVDKVAERISSILESRKKLESELAELPSVLKIHPSDANFLLVQFKDADGTYQKLAKNGIIVRNRSNQLHCEGCLRITVGTEEENSELISTLKSL